MGTLEPRGESPRYRSANARLTTTTGSDVSLSTSEKMRPAMTRIRSAEKYRGLTIRGDACTLTVPPSALIDFRLNALVDPPGVNGSSEVKAASVTPGIAARRPRTCSMMANRRSAAGYIVAGIDTRADRTSVGSKPRSALINARKLRPRSDAPTSSTQAIVTCPDMMSIRARAVRDRTPAPTGAVPSSPSASTRLSRRTRNAGNSPKTMLVPTETTSAKTRTTASTPSASRRGKSAGNQDGIDRCSSAVSARPAAPPLSPRSRLSTSSWRVTRALPAPSAARIAISRLLVVVRASCRLATFAVAVASSKPTATSSTTSGRRTSAVNASANGCAVTSIGPLLPKIAVVVMPVSAAKRPRAVPSAAACAAVTPGRSVAIALNIDRELPAVGRTEYGMMARVCRSGYTRLSGSTPTTV